ncbi:MAG: hypothetical protein IJ093_00615 [Bacilli bacterium]|nr:hypothetical protein [Bacilli bacterium]
MQYWTEYHGHEPDIRKNIDNTIYTFDIETTSYLILDNKLVNAFDYLKLSEDERDRANAQACMYVWQFSVNDQVYYGRTWQEFKSFLDRIEENCDKEKFVFVHNLSFEFQFLSGQFKFKEVLARKSRKVMGCKFEDWNITMRCTLFMSNVSLAYLPDLFKLPVKKMVGDLDYNLIRTPATELTEKELGYCKYDCLVVYEYIKMELDTYDQVNKIPMTSTGKVRKELQHIVLNDPNYRRIVGQCINIKPSVYNMLIEAFAGGYTHANWLYTDEILKDVDSYDETSAYPFVMVTEKFPMDIFKPCNLSDIKKLDNNYAYLIRIKFYNIECKYYNNFISASKCNWIVGQKVDNGRIIKAKMIDITLTDVDLKFIADTYKFEDYEIVESYFALKNYLPKQFIDFILDKYVNKTKFKNVEGKELEYAKEKNKFNSLYGMSVTNMIRDDVTFDDRGWVETPLDNSMIFDKLLEEKKKSFLSFAWGVWVTAYARDNLLRRVIELDQYVAYCDTDSCKLVQGYDKSIFEKYNKSVEEKIKKVAGILDIPLERYAPTDSKGEAHMLGVFENETGKGRIHTYDKFITQGAKKYCVEIDGQIHVTVSGVPKKGGAKCLKRIEDFRDDLIFDYENTNKKMLAYNDHQEPIEIIDYKGVKYMVTDKSGVCLLPTTYKLGKALEYADLLTDNSSTRSKFKQE